MLRMDASRGENGAGTHDKSPSPRGAGNEVGDAAFAADNYERAARLVDRLTANPVFESFLTLTAYQEID